jgi:YbgC/YbaW family acyl-CoA thioester hydrolase
MVDVKTNKATSYRFYIPYTVRIADINYGGHVSNAAVLSFFQDARIAYLKQFGYSELDIGGCGIILPEAHVLYHAEMFLGDELRIGVRISELRNAAFVMAYGIKRDGTMTTEGTTNLVAFDYQTRKARRLPEPFREAVTRFEGL